MPSKEHRERSRQRRRSSHGSPSKRSSSRPGSATASPPSPTATKWKRAARLVGTVRQLAGEAYEKGPERFAEDKFEEFREFADDAVFATEMGCREAKFHVERRMYDTMHDAMHEMNMRLNALAA